MPHGNSVTSAPWRRDLARELGVPARIDDGRCRWPGRRPSGPPPSSAPRWAAASMPGGEAAHDREARPGQAARQLLGDATAVLARAPARRRRRRDGSSAVEASRARPARAAGRRSRAGGRIPGVVPGDDASRRGAPALPARASRARVRRAMPPPRRPGPPAPASDAGLSAAAASGPPTRSASRRAATRPAEVSPCQPRARDTPCPAVAWKPSRVLHRPNSCKSPRDAAWP